MVRLGESLTGDEELKQLHGGVGHTGVASSGFDKEDGLVLRVLCEAPRTCQLIPSLFVRGPNLLNPGNARSGWNDGDAVRVAHRSGEVGRGGRIVADGHHVDVSGGGDEAAESPGRLGVPGEGAIDPKLGDRLPGADPEGSVVAVGFVAEVGKLVVSVGGRTRGSLGRAKRMEVWVEKTAWSSRLMVLSSTAWWWWRMLKKWLQSSRGRQLKGISSATMAVPQQEHKMGDVGGRGGSKRLIRRDMVYSRRERKEYRP